MFGADVVMKIIRIAAIGLLLACGVSYGVQEVQAQNAKDSGQSNEKSAEKNTTSATDDKAYSGMYSFRKDGEFVQLTVEEGGAVTGFISRFGDSESDKGAFLDQFFKTAKLDAGKLTFTTEIVHGVAFEFQGVVERGEGENPGDEAYFVLKGTLTENISDASKKVTSQSRPVLLKMFPQEAPPAPAARN
jgi:hypothetical protein